MTKKNNLNKIFPALYDMELDGMYTSGRLHINAEQGEQKEITSDKPIQVRINNGPWINVRPSDLNNK